MISRQQKAKLKAQHKKETSQTTEPFATCYIATSLGVPTAASCVYYAQEIKDLELQLGGTAMETLHEPCATEGYPKGLVCLCVVFSSPNHTSDLLPAP